ncbi:MAG: hypothetical protein JWN02_2090 [Acidobacteria bacterium]|nr:hypothetical protein [Acidobacteriota bacterium]
MKRALSLAFPFLLLLAAPLAAQQPVPAPVPVPVPAAQPATAPASQPNLLSIKELNLDGGERTVDDKNLVDINSDLTLTLDRAALSEAIAGSGLVTPGQSELLNRVASLQRLLATREASLATLTDALELHAQAAATGDPVSRQRAQSALTEAFKPLRDFFIKEPDTSPLMKAIGAAIARSNIFDKYAAVYSSAANEAAALTQQVSSGTLAATTGAGTPPTGGVYVQLGAWVRTESEDRPIHLPGFDEYPTGQFFEVQRWNVTLTATQQQQLATYASLAARVNSVGLKASIDWKAAGERLLSQVDQTPAGQCTLQLGTEVDGIGNDVNAKIAAVKKTLDAMKSSVTTYRQTLEEIRTRYSTGGSATKLTPDQFLVQSNGDISALVSDSTALATALTGDLQSIDDAIKALPADAKALGQQLQQLRDDTKKCIDTITQQIEELGANIVKGVKSLIEGRNFDDRALELGDQVNKLSLATLPPSTTIVLRQTGPRTNDDAIAIKLAVGTTAQNRQVIYQRQLRMFQILPHIDLKVGMIFADPKGQTELKRRFQAAPAYSILLKRGSYEHVQWNRWIEPGIGVNISSLDFNHDDAQELGLAVVASIFRDFLQVGYGYNITESKRYTMFGIRLPLPYFTLPLTGGGGAGTK